MQKLARRLLVAREARNSSTLWAWHACADPGFKRFHESLVREWPSAVGAGRPSPEGQRIRPHMLDDLFTGAEPRHSALGFSSAGRSASAVTQNRPYAVTRNPANARLPFQAKSPALAGRCVRLGLIPLAGCKVTTVGRIASDH